MAGNDDGDPDEISVGLLFGNFDESGKLESDFFDDVST